eukprot:TRINITY_DN6167_c0_g1_i5.p1 TRINITY_DN6167_c0_g1~~TRINITY_DN6167_c0_g1_i5.p1  ORF type:complete len:1819 (+),score=447.55 TRINITY_DN6167_c0_g1_i5:156-5612(+)
MTSTDGTAEAAARCSDVEHERQIRAKLCLPVVAAVASAPGLPPACQEMLGVAVEMSLAVPPIARDKRQVTIVGFIDETLRDVEAALATELAAAEDAEAKEAAVNGASRAERERVALLRVEEAKRSVVCARELLQIRLSSCDAAAERAEDASVWFKTADRARSTVDAELLATGLEREVCERGCVMLREGDSAGAKNTVASSKAVAEVHRFCKQIGLEDTLTLMLPVVVRKAPGERSSLDNAAAKMLLDALQKRSAVLQDRLEKGPAALLEPVARSEEARTVLNEAMARRTAAIVDLGQAQAEVTQVEAELREAERLAKESADEVQRAVAASTEARRRLAKFREGALAVFRELRGPVEEEKKGEQEKAPVTSEVEDAACALSESGAEVPTCRKRLRVTAVGTDTDELVVEGAMADASPSPQRRRLQSAADAEVDPIETATAQLASTSETVSSTCADGKAEAIEPAARTQQEEPALSTEHQESDMEGAADVEAGMPEGQADALDQAIEQGVSCALEMSQMEVVRAAVENTSNVCGDGMKEEVAETEGRQVNSGRLDEARTTKEDAGEEAVAVGSIPDICMERIQEEHANQIGQCARSAQASGRGGEKVEADTESPVDETMPRSTTKNVEEDVAAVTASRLMDAVVPQPEDVLTAPVEVSSTERRIADQTLNVQLANDEKLPVEALATGNRDVGQEEPSLPSSDVAAVQSADSTLIPEKAEPSTVVSSRTCYAEQLERSDMAAHLARHKTDQSEASDEHDVAFRKDDSHDEDGISEGFRRQLMSEDSLAQSSRIEPLVEDVDEGNVNVQPFLGDTLIDDIVSGGSVDVEVAVGEVRPIQAETESGHASAVVVDQSSGVVGDETVFLSELPCVIEIPMVEVEQPPASAQDGSDCQQGDTGVSVLRGGTLLDELCPESCFDTCVGEVNSQDVLREIQASDTAQAVEHPPASAEEAPSLELQHLRTDDPMVEEPAESLPLLALERENSDESACGQRADLRGVAGPMPSSSESCSEAGVDAMHAEAELEVDVAYTALGKTLAAADVRGEAEEGEGSMDDSAQLAEAEESAGGDVVMSSVADASVDVEMGILSADEMPAAVAEHASDDMETQAYSAHSALVAWQGTGSSSKAAEEEAAAFLDVVEEMRAVAQSIHEESRTEDGVADEGTQAMETDGLESHDQDVGPDVDLEQVIQEEPAVVVELAAEAPTLGGAEIEADVRDENVAACAQEADHDSTAATPCEIRCDLVAGDYAVAIPEETAVESPQRICSTDARELAANHEVGHEHVPASAQEADHDSTASTASETRCDLVAGEYAVAIAEEAAGESPQRVCATNDGELVEASQLADETLGADVETGMRPLHEYAAGYGNADGGSPDGNGVHNDDIDGVQSEAMSCDIAAARVTEVGERDDERSEVNEETSARGDVERVQDKWGEGSDEEEEFAHFVGVEDGKGEAGKVDDVAENASARDMDVEPENIDMSEYPAEEDTELEAMEKREDGSAFVLPTNGSELTEVMREAEDTGDQSEGENDATNAIAGHHDTMEMGVNEAVEAVTGLPCEEDENDFIDERTQEKQEDSERTVEKERCSDESASERAEKDEENYDVERQKGEQAVDEDEYLSVRQGMEHEGILNEDEKQEVDVEAMSGDAECGSCEHAEEERFEEIRGEEQGEEAGQRDEVTTEHGVDVPAEMAPTQVLDSSFDGVGRAVADVLGQMEEEMLKELEQDEEDDAIGDTLRYDEEFLEDTLPDVAVPLLPEVTLPTLQPERLVAPPTQLLPARLPIADESISMFTSPHRKRPCPEELGSPQLSAKRAAILQTSPAELGG